MILQQIQVLHVYNFFYESWVSMWSPSRQWSQAIRKAMVSGGCVSVSSETGSFLQIGKLSILIILKIIKKYKHTSKLWKNFPKIKSKNYPVLHLSLTFSLIPLRRRLPLLPFLHSRWWGPLASNLYDLLWIKRIQK